MTHSKRERWLLVSGLLLVCAVVSPVRSHAGAGAPGSPLRLAATGSPGDGSTIAETPIDLEPVEAYRLALLEMKGHLSVARTLIQLGESGAAYHLSEPIRKIFQSVRPELDERNAPLTSDILVQLERAADIDPRPALATLDSAAAAIDGSFAQPGVVTASSALDLSESLLREAVAWYSRSVENNEVVDLRGYQTGRGLVIQAEALVRHSTGLKSKPGYERLLADVVLIRQAWPGVIPPPIVFDPGSVADRLVDAETVMRGMR